MASLFPSIWNLLHDGCIERIEGNVRGDLSVFVSIEYLRSRFQDTGDCIVVKLIDCSQFAFRNYETKQDKQQQQQQQAEASKAETEPASLDAIAEDCMSKSYWDAFGSTDDSQSNS
jgi:hypothetical protein